MQREGVCTVAKEAVLNNDALSPYYIAKISRFERFALNSLLKKLIIFLANVISSANRLVVTDSGWRYQTVKHHSIINQYTDYFVSHILKNYTASKRQRLLQI